MISDPPSHPTWTNGPDSAPTVTPAVPQLATPNGPVAPGEPRPGQDSYPQQSYPTADTSTAGVAGTVRPRLNVAAVLGLVFAVVFWPVGLVLSVIGLVKARRRQERGRGFAITGLAVSLIAAAVTITLGVLVAGILSGDALRGIDGAIVIAGKMPIDDLRAGDCVLTLPTKGPAVVTPCSTEHRVEVTGIVRYEGEWPGAALWLRTEASCSNALREFAPGFEKRARVMSAPIKQTKEQWLARDRTVVCVAITALRSSSIRADID
jgi:hypothetical protein